VAARHGLIPYDRSGAGPPISVWAVEIIASYLAAVVCYRARNQPLALTGSLAAIVAAGVVADRAQYDLILNERDFYGIHQIRNIPADSTHLLLNGTTKHGAQSFAAGRRREPMSYYTRTGPLGDVFREIAAAPGRSIAVVGLGTGATAAYGATGERWTVYEIDPAVERIARDSRYFTYLADSPARIEVVLGDGRLSMVRANDGLFSLIVVDAFSSDAIPVHLLTREALALYFRKLAPGGVLAFHLSNRYLNLEPVVARLARDAHAAARIRENVPRKQAVRSAGEDASVWAVLAPRPTSLGGLTHDPRWRPLRERPDIDTWTDDFSNVLQVLTIAKPF
jgi:SAM-dependent methyltransferase